MLVERGEGDGHSVSHVVLVRQRCVMLVTGRPLAVPW